MVRLLTVFAVGSASPSLVAAPKLTASITPDHAMVFVADQTFHADYGLSYPLTYQIGVPAGATDLSLYRRHSSAATWTRITERTSADFFNAEEAVRFDAASNIAYASCAFGTTTDSLFLKITDGSGSAVPIEYRGISRFYDNRQAAVTLTADDWFLETVDDFNQALGVFRSLRLWTTVGIITDYAGGPAWSMIQGQLDSGLVEAASHSRQHLHVPYPDLAAEVAGSQSDILDNLTLPPLFTRGAHQYVYVWIAPFGEVTTDVENAAGQAKYIVSRGTTLNGTDFSAWNPGLHIYNATTVTRELGPLYGGSTDITDLNAAFDAAVASGGIYHMMCHPKTMEWSRPYTMAHLEHISGHTNIWYASMGHLYLYHFLQDTATGPVVVLPTVVTDQPSDVSMAGATLRGNVNPQGAATTCHFEYGPTALYGSRTADTVLPAGTSSLAVRATLTGLSPFTLYHFRLVAQHGSGITVPGNDQTFRTFPPPPIVTGGAATNVGSTSARVNGSIDTRGAATTYHFVYGTTQAYGRATPDFALPAGGGTVAVSAPLDSLTPVTTYHYALVADNGSGQPVISTDTVFTTLPPPPTVTTGTPTDVRADSALFRGTINPNGFSTRYHFEFGPTTSYGFVTPESTLTAGTVTVSVNHAVAGLSPLMLYHYRLIADNGSGIPVAGEDRSFTTLPLPPIATISPATAITFRSAGIRGTIHPRGAATVYHFEFGTTTSYGSVTADSTLPAGTDTVTVAAVLTGLAPETLYHVRLAADNGSGSTAHSADRVFTTLPVPPPPIVLTGGITGLGARAATVHGTIDPRGSETSYHVEYGTSGSYGSASAESVLAAGADSVDVSILLTGLAPATSYHFRLVGDNGSGSPVYGDDRVFTTLVPPPIITVSDSLLPDFGGTKVGATSPPATYNLAGVDLAENILVQAPTGFEVSLDGVVYDSTVTVAHTGGIVPSTVVYARFTPLFTGVASGGIVNSSQGAVPRIVEVAGTGQEHYSHTRTLSRGWNIISSYLSPQDLNMLYVLQPLIDAAKLVKCQDETGNAIERLPGIGWVNNIGDWQSTRGYYLKADSVYDLTITGPATPLPFTIPLSAGWHIISYARPTPMDASTAVQPLINANRLVKVQNESGNAIEYLPGIGWLNNIGQFLPGQGYYLKVNGATSLTYDSASSTHKIAASSVPSAQPVHFRVVHEGNPFSPMNIYVRVEGETGLKAGMEIGLFDGSLCVGAAVFDGPSLSTGVLSIIAGMNDPLTDRVDGFVEGHPIVARLWDGDTDSDLPLVLLSGPDPAVRTAIFAAQGTAILTALPGSREGVAEPDSPALLDCYPNPFNPSTTLTYRLSAPERVRLSIINILGEEMCVLVDGYVAKGTHTVRWDGRETNGATAPSGVYLARLTLQTQSYTRKMMLLK